ncbi:MAG TPA: hypothetical protein VIP78_04625 [Candidatus Dormibacteraeota bacterium]|jgi:hypothetical protein
MTGEVGQDGALDRAGTDLEEEKGRDHPGVGDDPKDEAPLPDPPEDGGGAEHDENGAAQGRQ